MDQETKDTKEQCECVKNGDRGEFRKGKCWFCYGKEEVKEKNSRELYENGKINVPL